MPCQSRIQPNLTESKFTQIYTRAANPRTGAQRACVEQYDHPHDHRMFYIPRGWPFGQPRHDQFPLQLVGASCVRGTPRLSTVIRLRMPALLEESRCMLLLLDHRSRAAPRTDQPFFQIWWMSPPECSPGSGGEHQNNRRSYVGSEMRVLRTWAASGRARGEDALPRRFSAWLTKWYYVFFVCYSCSVFLNTLMFLLFI